jgi:hypothetical protein
MSNEFDHKVRTKLSQPFDQVVQGNIPTDDQVVYKGES